MITKLMEDTCLKDMQATKLSSLKTEKHLQVHRLPKALRSMEWTSSSSGIHCSTLLFSSSLKIFTILTSIGESAPTSTRRPSSNRPKRATSVQSADTTGFRMTKFLALFANNNTPAAHPTRLATFPRIQAASRKPQATSSETFRIWIQATSNKRQASSRKRQAARYLSLHKVFHLGTRH